MNSKMILLLISFFACVPVFVFANGSEMSEIYKMLGCQKESNGCDVCKLWRKFSPIVKKYEKKEVEAMGNQEVAGAIKKIDQVNAQIAETLNNLKQEIRGIISEVEKLEKEVKGISELRAGNYARGLLHQMEKAMNIEDAYKIILAAERHNSFRAENVKDIKVKYEIKYDNAWIGITVCTAAFAAMEQVMGPESMLSGDNTAMFLKVLGGALEKADVNFVNIVNINVITNIEANISEQISIKNQYPKNGGRTKSKKY